jgi:hypothetical protein
MKRNDLTKYAQVRPQMQGGDIIAFDGSCVADIAELADHFLSNAIEVITRSALSHVGMVLDYSLPIGGKPQTELNLIESTMMTGKSGPQINPLAQRIAEYDGRVWWLPLSFRAWVMIDWPTAWQFALGRVGKDHYSVKSIGDFIARKLPILQWLPFVHKAEPDAEVCSEYIAEILRAGGLPGIDCHEVSPQKLVEMRIYRDVVQLVGTPREIRNFNTV